MIGTVSSDTIIYRIENTFGLDNSDWIPRIPEFVCNALGDLGISQTNEMVTRKIVVDDENMFYIPKDFQKLVGIYSSYGCLITEHNPVSHARLKASYQFGKINVIDITTINKTITYDENGNIIQKRFQYLPGYADIDLAACPMLHYIVPNKKQIKLLGKEEKYVWFTYITSLKTSGGKIDIPNIPAVIDAIIWYCFWMILSRGMQHPVYSLSGRNHTNPQWLYMNMYKTKATNEYVSSGFNEEFNRGLDDIWNSSFYNVMKNYL